jgi:hypothetical protein
MPRGEQSTAIPVITWDEFKARIIWLWRRFCSEVKSELHRKIAPPAVKPMQPRNPAVLFYFIERGRRSYERGISFAQWSDRMIIVHGDEVIPYLHEAWEYVKGEIFPVIIDGRPNGANHVNGTGTNGHAKKQVNWKTFAAKLHWKIFAGGIAVGALLCAGFLFAFTPHSKYISTGDAKNHIGESMAVAGTVSEIHVSRKGTVLIDMDGNFPNEQFTAVWLAPGAPVAQIQNFDGKTISVKGTIQEYRGRPEIILTSMSQISE